MKTSRIYYLTPLLFTLLLLVGCTGPVPSNEPGNKVEAEGEVSTGYDDPRGVFVLNEGNFSSPKGGSLLYISPSGEVEENVFRKVNKLYLGKLPQDMCFRDGVGYILTQEGSRKTGLPEDQVAGQLTSFDPKTLVVKKCYTQELPKYNPTTHLAVLDRDNILIRCGVEQKTSELYRLLPKSRPPLYSIWHTKEIRANRMAVTKLHAFAAAGSEVIILPREGIETAGTIFMGKTPDENVEVTGVIANNNDIWVATTGDEDRISKVDGGRMEIMESHVLPKGALTPTPRVPSITAKGDTLYFCGNTPLISRHIFSTGTTEQLIDTSKYVDYPSPIVYGGLAVNPVTGKVYISLISDYKTYDINDLLEIDFSVKGKPKVKKYSNLTSFPAGIFFPPTH